LLIKQGYLKEGYNPLTLNPFIIKRLLYNPEPFGRLIGRAYLEAMESLDPTSEYIGRATMENIERELARPEMISVCNKTRSIPQPNVCRACG
jgi:hypothetical protein